MRIGSPFALFDIKKSMSIATLRGDPQMLSSKFSAPTLSSDRLAQIAVTICVCMLGTTTLAGVKPSDPELGEKPVPVIRNESAGYSVNLTQNIARFNVVDLLIEGDGGKLPIVVSRTHDIYRRNPAHRVPQELGNWALDVPRITSWRGTKRSDGVNISYYATPNVWSRGYCHNPVYVQGTGQAATDLFWWIGLLLEVPQRGARELIFSRQDSAGGQIVYPPINVITGLKGNVEYITTDNWRADCIDLPQGPRSGFLVHAPDGTKYTFDVFASPKSIINDRMNWDDSLAAHVYASRVEDAFGNYLEYSYEADGNGGLYVSEIRASDGRIVKFYYDVVDHSNHPFWRPQGTVKRLARVEHVSADESEVLADVHYFYYISETQVFADHGTLGAVRTPDGRYWDYSYQDHDRMLSNSDPRYPPPPGYWGTVCDYAVGFTNWYCGPTFSTLPAKLTRLTTPAGAFYTFDYIDTSGPEGWASDRGINFNYTWVVDRIGTDRNMDLVTDYTSFRLSNGPQRETFLNEVTFSHDRKDVYTFIRSKYAPGSEVSKARLTTLLGGSIKSHEIFDTKSGTPVLLKRTDLDWDVRRQVGDHARTCWIGECDKADLWSTVLTSSTRQINGQTYTTAYSDFTEFDQAQTIAESSPDVSRTTHVSYRNDENPWILGMPWRQELVGEGFIDRGFGLKGDLRYMSTFGTEVYYDYDTRGNVSRQRWPTRVGEPWAEILFENHKLGIPQRTVFPTGHIVTRVVNDDGTIASETNARGFERTFSYDAIRRPTSVIHPKSAMTTIDWTGPSDRERVESKGNREDVVRLDRFEREIWTRVRDKVSSQPAAYVRNEYDEADRVIFSSREAANLAYPYGTAYDYDALGRVLLETDTATGDEIKYCYGIACNSARAGRPPVEAGYVVTDAEGYEIIMDFELYGEREVVSKIVQQVDLAPPRYITTTIERNDLGDFASITQGGHTRRYEYNDRNLIEKYIDPETADTELKYDLAGNVIQKLVGGVSVSTHFYDELNRMKTSIGDLGRSTVISMLYDENGNIKNVTRDRIVRNFEYDEEDNIIEDTLTTPGLSFSTTYEYDQHGARVAANYPSGWRITYSPDALGQPRVVQGLMGGSLSRLFASQVEYDLNGSLKSFRYGNNLRFRHTDNSKALLKELSVYDAQFNYISRLNYEYNPRSNISTITDGVSAQNSKSLFYDGLSRLLTVDRVSEDEVYSYDDASNLRSRQIGSLLTTYSYNGSNRLSSTSDGRSFGYDLRGNIVSNGVHQLDFDAFDNVISIAGPTNETYSYDGEGKRVISTIGAVQTISAYSPSGRLMHQLSRPGGDTKDFIYIGDQLVASISCSVADADSDNDIIPDCYEVRWGLNPLNAADALYDSDGDGLSNREEFLLGANPLSTDSDGDGMPDGFEVENGLDVLQDDAAGDLDGDGASNLDEYISGDNPNYNPAWITPILQIILDD